MTPISFNNKALSRTVDSYGYHAGGRAIWLPVSTDGLPRYFNGEGVWTDGTDIYFRASNCFTYKLDKSTNTWSQVYVGFATGMGHYTVFKDGTTIYACYINGNAYRVYQFDYNAKRFSTYYDQDYATQATDIWYNGGDIYFSMNTGVVDDPAHNLKWNRSTHKWEPVPMYFNPSLHGTYGLVGNAVWNYKGDSYVGDWDYDGNFLRLYKFNHSTSTWNETSWNGYCNVQGIDMWTDYNGVVRCRSHGSQYRLDPSIDQWLVDNNYLVLANPPTGYAVWSDGDNIFYSYYDSFYNNHNYILVRQ